MKVRPRGESSSAGLPPPPAPPARDANPWQMPQGVDGQQREPRHPRAPRGSPPGRVPRQAPAARRRGKTWAPLLILFVVAGTVMQLAIRALHDGDVEGAVGAIVMLMMVAFVVVRRVMKRKD